jgi:hypothetical protein
MIDKVQEPSNSECYTSFSELFRTNMFMGYLITLQATQIITVLKSRMINEQ